MLTKEDKEFLTETFATKEEISMLKGITKDVTDLKVEQTLLQREMIRLGETVNRIEGKADKMLAIAEKTSGRIADLDQENKFGAVILHRHDVQIHELATATGTKISD